MRPVGRRRLAARNQARRLSADDAVSLLCAFVGGRVLRRSRAFLRASARDRGATRGGLLTRPRPTRWEPSWTTAMGLAAVSLRRGCCPQRSSELVPVRGGRGSRVRRRSPPHTAVCGPATGPIRTHRGSALSKSLVRSSSESSAKAYISTGQRSGQFETHALQQKVSVLLPPACEADKLRAGGAQSRPFQWAARMLSGQQPT
jgi:hypothetical protein